MSEVKYSNDVPRALEHKHFRDLNNSSSSKSSESTKIQSEFFVKNNEFNCKRQTLVDEIESSSRGPKELQPEDYSNSNSSFQSESSEESSDSSTETPVLCGYLKHRWLYLDRDGELAKNLMKNSPLKVSEKLIDEWREELFDESREIRNIFLKKEDKEKDVINENIDCSLIDEEADNCADASEHGNAVFLENGELNVSSLTISKVLQEREIKSSDCKDALSEEEHSDTASNSNNEMNKTSTKFCAVKLKKIGKKMKKVFSDDLKANKEDNLKCEEISKDECDNSNRTYQKDSEEQKLHSSRLHKKILKCCSIKIGSFAEFSNPDSSCIVLIFTPKGISFNVYAFAKSSYILAVTMKSCDIVSASINVESSSSAVFLDMTANFMDNLKKLFEWSIKYIDVTLKAGEQNRIVFRFDTKTDDLSKFLCNFLGVNKIQDRRTGNEICTEFPQKQKVPAKNKSRKDTGETKIQFCAHDPNGVISITNEDMDCLDEGKLLRGAIIDLYAKYIYWEKLTNHERTKIHIFNTHFLPDWLKIKNPRLQELHEERIARWTKHVDIFSKDYIIIPLNRKEHWFLAIICFPGKVSHVFLSHKSNHASSIAPLSGNKADESKLNSQEDVVKGKGRTSASKVCVSKNKELSVYVEKIESQEKQKTKKQWPCIYFFNSVRRYNAKIEEVASTLREYLKMEWEDKKKTKLSFDSENLPSIIVPCPEQKNGYDCGLYVMQYMLNFLEEPILYNGDTVPDMSAWFTSKEVSKMRHQIKEMIVIKSSTNLK